MTTRTTKFIEDAIAGGWNEHPTHKTVARESGAKIYLNNENDDSAYIPVSEILLDPAAWNAVAKTRGWNEQGILTVWEWNQFFSNLWRGATIEEALGTIS